MRSLSKDKSWELARKVALTLVPQLGASPELTAVCLKALRDHDGRTLANLAVSPGDYSSSSLYAKDAQCVDLLRKYVGLPSGIDTRAVAIDGFKQWEEWCRLNNNALLDASCNTSNSLTNHCLTMLDRARSVVSTILGKAPNLERLRFEFGPGATSQCKANTPKSKKYAQKVHCTPRLAEAWLANASEFGPKRPLADVYGMDPEILSYDKIDSVHKTAKTDRTIGIPVHLNAFVQRGCGLAIRAKLDSYLGLNLAEVPEYHALLAGVAHIDRLSTIDLSAASDTISFVLVRLLLPQDWFDLLMTSRVDYYCLDGKIGSYEKFSAMGNGFTFELETLLFYALAVVAVADELETTTFAVKHSVSVFGDDIICPRHASKRVLSNLKIAGFVVNREKTFLDGAFFESCGSDFFDGHAVRSVFLKELRTPLDVITLHNMIIEISQRESNGQHRAIRFKATCDFLRTVLKTWFDRDFSQCMVPNGYTHGLVSSFDEALPTLVRSQQTAGYHKIGNKRVKFLRQGWQGWQHKYCQFVPYTHDSSQSKLGLDRWLYEKSRIPVSVPSQEGNAWIEEALSLQDPQITSTESIRRRGRYSVGLSHYFSEWCGPSSWG